MEPQLELISKDGRELVYLSNIIYLESDGSYCYIHYYNKKGKRQKHYQSKGLYKMRESLDERFVPLDRGIIVNRNRVNGYSKNRTVKLDTDEEDTFSVPKEMWENVKAAILVDVRRARNKVKKTRKGKDDRPPNGQLEIPFP